MPEVVIADTSCLILLSNINELELLHQVYGDITTTTTIADEYGQDLPSWIKIKSPFDLVKQQLLAIQVDNGEASAIALALEIPDSLLILDDLQGRKLARQLNITMTGTLGVIVKAKTNGIIQSIKPILSKIKQTDFRITAVLEQAALEQAGEL